MIRLNSAVSDMILFIGGTVSTKTSVSWGWYLAPDTNEAYFVSKFPELSISANLDDDQFKEDFNLSITVSGADKVQPLSVNSEVIFVNYPIHIKEKTTDKNPISLPSSSNDQSSTVAFPMENYFSGWINKYEIACSYVQEGYISLETPVRKSKEFEIKGYSKDMVNGNGFNVVLD